MMCEETSFRGVVKYFILECFGFNVFSVACGCFCFRFEALQFGD